MKPETTEALRQGNWSKASKELVQWLRTNSQDDKAVYNLIVCYMKLNRLKDARAVMEEEGAKLDMDDRLALQEELDNARPVRKPRTAPKPKVKEVKAPELDKGGNPIQEKTKTKDGQITDLAWFKSDTKLDSVIGLLKVKQKLKKNIIGPMINPKLYKRIGAATSGGVILYGPPGTGKTLLARACAGEVGGQILLVRISEIVSKYMGDSGKNISRIFEEARKSTVPSLIFIDELDAIAQKREGTVETTTAPEERRIIDNFLTEIDGIGKNNQGVFCLGATNEPWALDEAFTRSGRFSKKIYCGPPGTNDRISLFKFYVKGKKIAKKINYLKLALLTFGRSPADIRQVCEDAATSKAHDIQFLSMPETEITTNDLAEQIKELGETPMLFSWYANTLEKLRNIPPEQLNQYQELKKDIEFWTAKGPARLKLYRAIAAGLH